MAWGENYGLPFVVDQQAGLDASGNIVAWDYETWSATLGNRPGNNAPGNVASGLLLGFCAAGRRAARAARRIRTTSTTATTRSRRTSTGRVGGKNNGTGIVASERVLTHTVPSPFLTGPLRSPARLQNAFAQECFFDEIAAQAKADPVQYRLRHISDQRLKDVITAAAKQANWDTRPSPKAGTPRTGIASGRGMACVLYEGDNGYVGLVAEVDVNQDTGVGQREADRCRAGCRARSRARMACATSSKAARCRD